MSLNLLVGIVAFSDRKRQLSGLWGFGIHLCIFCTTSESRNKFMAGIILET